MSKILISKNDKHIGEIAFEDSFPTKQEIDAALENFGHGEFELTAPNGRKWRIVKKRHNKLSDVDIVSRIYDLCNKSPTEGRAELVRVNRSMDFSTCIESWIVRINGSVTPREAALHVASSIPGASKVVLYLNDIEVDMTDYNVVD